MKRSFLLMAAALFSTGALAQSIWKLDKANAHLTFSIKHLAVSSVDGTFKDFDASISASKADFSDAKFSFKANAASVNTDNQKRDADLKSPNFFNAAKYPAVTFKSTSIKPASSANHYVVTGDLTITGVTKPTTLQLWYRGTKAHGASFQVTGTVKRSDYHFGSKYGSPMMGDDVSFKAAGEFARTN
ncbi:MAG TPA: YceI family protein [Mucilaginibacter sp.]|nr:YceI family protein [Mucilaginibacter sp.]